MDWVEKENALHKTFAFKTFADAIKFMSVSVQDINRINHHPDWSNIYNRVTCALSTHDAGNIVTEKDHELAKILDANYLKVVKGA